MALQGDLASVDLAQIFQMLALSQKAGLLVVEAADDRKALYFDSRGVTLYYNEHTLLDRVLARMVRTGMLAPSIEQQARHHASSTGASVADALLAGACFTEDQLEAGYRSEMEEEIYDLFFWDAAQFQFFEGASTLEGREGSVSDRMFFATDSLIMEAARRIDEWSYIRERVFSAQEIYQPSLKDGNALGVDDTAMSVLDFVDGKRTVARMVEVAGLSSFNTYKALASLLDEGLIKSISLQDIVPLAEEAASEHRLRDATNLFEKAVVLGVGIPHVHSRLSEIYEQAEEYGLSADHLKKMSEFHVAGQDLDAAIEKLVQAIELIPTDLDARERLVELTVGHADHRPVGLDPVAEGRTLVDLYLEVGDTSRVREILERLLLDNPADLELKKSLANVHSKAGDTRRVIELYESIAEDLTRDRRPIEAVKYLHKILRIDRSRKDVSERIRRIYEVDQKRRSRRHRLMIMVLSAGVILAAVAGWYGYDRHADQLLREISVQDLVADHQHSAAINVYKEFARDYPLTFAAKSAEEEIARIDNLRLDYEAGKEKNRLRAEANINRARTTYRLDWERYLAAFSGHDLDAASAALNRVWEGVEESGQAEDREWAASKQVEKNLRELKEYISAAKDIEEKGRQYLASGQWREAREALLVLTERYEMTRLAKQALLPVMINSRPSGALILKDGHPVKSGEAIDSSNLVTPALVYCHPRIAETFTLSRHGFEARRITVVARKSAEVDCVLTIKPQVAMRFGESLASAISVANGHAVVGLGSKVIVGKIADDRVIRTIQLDDLVKMEGHPAMSRDGFFFRTTDDRIHGYRLPGARQIFSMRPVSRPVQDPVCKDGRVMFGDEDGKLVCLGMSDGRVLWRQSLGGRISGPPMLHERRIRVGTESAEVIVLDASNGAIIKRHGVSAAVTTSVILAAPLVVFGTSDGHLMAMNERDGRVAWRHDLGRSPRAGELCRVGDAVAAVDEDDRFVLLDAKTGHEIRFRQLSGKRTRGPLIVGNSLLLVVERGVGGGKRCDRILALHRQTLEIAWEYSTGEKFRGPLTTDGVAAYLPGPDGEALRFR
ncbi:MAG: PQQ-binding-like beta-propeller repeat protein [Planctomycetota bacterium]|nr:PQQ-binding-like beta-propeller repeat protein [Planctomycetota bacterium]